MDTIQSLTDKVNNKEMSIADALAAAYRKGVADLEETVSAKSVRVSTEKNVGGKHVYMRAVGTNFIKSSSETLQAELTIE